MGTWGTVEARAAALPAPASSLAEVALAALAVAEDAPHRGWTTAADRAAARRTTDEMETIVRGAADRPAPRSQRGGPVPG